MSPWPQSIAARPATLHLCGALVSVFAAWLAWGWYQQRENERRFALENGCLALQPRPGRWPLGLDILRKAFVHRGHTMELIVMGMEKSGNTSDQTMLGARAVGTSEPENIEAVLSSKYNDYSLGVRSTAFSALLGSGIFTQDGPAWKHSRQLLRPQFATNKTLNFEYTRSCVEDIIASVPADGVVDLQPLSFKLTFDTTMFMIFGESATKAGGLRELVGGKDVEFAKVFDTAQAYLARRGVLGKFYWILDTREFRDACRWCHEFVDRAVARALEEVPEGGEAGGTGDEKVCRSFVEELVLQTRDPLVLRDQCLNVLLAGRDTTACCIQWTFRLLARHQDVLKRLREEIDGVCGLGPNSLPPTREDLRNMTYLNLIIKEVLRLYPSVPMNAREAVRMTVLPRGGGPDRKSPLLIRPGDLVRYSVYAMHRRKDIYGDDANEFRPERWEDDTLKDVGWGYLPFNGGPRLCLGKEFALLSAAYTIARVVQVFPKMELPPTEEHVPVGKEKQTLTLVISSADGCVVSLK